MLHLYDRATMAHALTLDLEPRLQRLLADRIGALSPELIDYTEFLIIQAGDAEEDIIRCIGLSPLVEPIEGIRYGEPGFHPHWDWLGNSEGWFEMIFTFGSAFAYVLLIEDADGSLPEVRSMCRQFCHG